MYHSLSVFFIVYGSHSNTTSLCQTDVEKLGLWVAVTLTFYVLLHTGIYQAVNYEEITYCSLFSFQGNCRQFGCVVSLLQCEKVILPHHQKGTSCR